MTLRLITLSPRAVDFRGHAIKLCPDVTPHAKTGYVCVVGRTNDKQAASMPRPRFQRGRVAPQAGDPLCPSTNQQRSWRIKAHSGLIDTGSKRVLILGFADPQTRVRIYTRRHPMSAS